MSSLGLWTAFKDFKPIRLPKSKHPSKVGIINDGLIIFTNDNSILLIPKPYSAVSKTLNFSESVCEISCNRGMALFLTHSGSVWLFGEDTTKSSLFAIEGTFKSDQPIKLHIDTYSKIISASLSNCHGGMVCTEGFLYTWGKGSNGELGCKTIKACGPSKVENGNIFKAKQVVCGNGYTGVSTQGGFLYIYGTGVKCECGSINGYPYTVPALEEYYVTKAYQSPFGIVVITDAWKCYIVKGCLCLTNLRANKKIEHIASCSDGICGLTRDKKALYVWTKVEKDWKEEAYRVCEGDIAMLANSLGKVVAIIGENMKKFPGVRFGANESPSLSPFSRRDVERKSFEQLLGAYNFGMPVTNGGIQREEGCREIVDVLTKVLAESFRKIKEHSYLKWVYKRAYASTFTPNILIKVVQRLNVLDKAFAFAALENYSKCAELFKDPRTIKLRKGIKVLSKVGENKILKAMMTMIKQAYVLKYYEIAMKPLKRVVYVKRLESALLQMIPPKRYNNVNPFVFAIKVIEKHKTQALEQYFHIWQTSAADPNFQIFTRQKLNSALCVFIKLSKAAKRRFKWVFAILHPQKNIYQIKYGLYFLSTYIKKTQNRHKGYSFNSILRQKARPMLLENFFDILKLIYRGSLAKSFNSIKAFSINKSKNRLIQFILMLQAIQEKIKYRKVIRGYNAFKIHPFNKSMIVDFISDKSFNLKSSIKQIKTPNSDSPTFEFTNPTTERSMTETSIFHSDRRSSLHNFQQYLVKKFSDKLSTESKSGVLGKAKNLIEKNKPKENGLEKRKAYNEILKERQKKKVTTKIQSSMIMSSGKRLAPNSTIKKEQKNVSFDVTSWKKMKYENAVGKAEICLNKLLKLKKKVIFIELKTTVKNLPVRNKEKTEPKPELKRSQCKYYPSIQIQKKNSTDSITGPKKYKINLPSPRFNCDSPIESPISHVLEDTFLSQPKMYFEEKSPRNVEIGQVSSWKVKLYALGLNKFSRLLRLIAGKMLWDRIKSSNY